MKPGSVALFALLLTWLPGVGVAESAADSPPLGVFIPQSPPQPAPAIDFTDAKGRSFNLSDFAGKLVLVNLWATWCAPCRHEMPSLEQLQTRLGDKITILAISEDSRGEKVVAPFVAELGLTAVKTYLDPGSAVSQAFKVDGLPTSFLIDRNGRVLGRVEGEADWDSPRMLAIIDPLLSEGGVVKTSFRSARP
jgi:thiol-disulfide isomerase/thioredoxin